MSAIMQILFSWILSLLTTFLGGIQVAQPVLDVTADLPPVTVQAVDKPIATQADLEAISEDPSAKYYLTQDILLDGDFQPLCSETAFSGTLDGKGHTIRNMNVTVEETVEELPVTRTIGAGLFASNSGTIRNLTVEGNVTLRVTYSGASSTKILHVVAGGLAGYNRGTLANCVFNGTVTAEGINENERPYIYAYAGGMAGQHKSGNLESCAVSAAVDAKSNRYAYSGGIMGLNEFGAIFTSSSTGKIDATAGFSAYAGGLAGYMESDTFVEDSISNMRIDAYSENAECYAGGLIGYSFMGMVVDCGAFGAVDSCYSRFAYAYAGGIMGRSNANTIEQSYSATVLPTGLANGKVGGIAGKAASSTIQNCYYLENVSCGVDDGTDTAIPKSREQMKVEASFAGYNFDDIWEMRTLFELPIPIGCRVHPQITKLTLRYDSVCTLGAHLSGVTDSTAQSVLANFENFGLVLLDQNGEKVTDMEAVLGTGCTVALVGVDGTVYDSTTLVIYGDIDGDGVADGNDSFILSCYLSDMVLLDDAQTAAADADGNGEVNPEDVTYLFACGMLQKTVEQVR